MLKKFDLTMPVCKKVLGSTTTSYVYQKVGVANRRCSEMIEIYIDNTLRICTIAFLADAVYRLCMVFWEYWNYLYRYLPHNRFLQIFKRCFSYSSTWVVCFGLWVFILLLRFASTQRNPLSQVKGDLPYMPLYWIFRMLQSPHSNLDYAEWIRAPYGLDYGEGMAFSYFHGYINLTMPSHTGDNGIRDRIALYSNRHGVEFAIDRLIILIPDIMYVPPKFESKILKKAAPLETVILNRAGVKRPYKNDVYRFKEKINGKTYYVAVEGATPLVTFFEAMHSNYTSTPQMIEMEREILFKFSQSLKRMVKEYPGTRNEVEIVFYKVDNTHDIGEVIKAHLEYIWAKDNPPDDNDNEKQS